MAGRERLKYQLMKKIGFLLILLFAHSSCKKDEVEKQEDELSLEYKPGVVRVNHSPEEVILSADESTQMYSLNKSAFDKQPRVGEVILIQGEIMHKVKAIRSAGDRYEVEMEPAALTDVIENGTIAFEVQPEWGDASSLRIEGKEMLNRGSRLSIEPIEFNMNVSGVDHKILITPKMEDGKINSCTFRFQMSKGGSTSFEAVGTATLPKQKTLIYIEDGKLKEFKSENSGLDAAFKVHMDTAGGDSGEHSLSLPKMALTFPLRYIPTPVGLVPNPIPMSIEVGVQFVSQMTLPDAMSSASAESSVSYSARGGFEYKGADVAATGDLSRSEIKDGRFDSAAGFGMPVDLQFGVAFPRISFNIVSQEVAFVHVGYTTGSRLQWGPLCKSGYSKVVVEGGYTLSALGQTIVSGKTTFKEDVKKAGDNCD